MAKSNTGRSIIGWLQGIKIICDWAFSKKPDMSRENPFCCAKIIEWELQEIKIEQEDNESAKGRSENHSGLTVLNLHTPSISLYTAGLCGKVRDAGRGVGDPLPGGTETPFSVVPRMKNPRGEGKRRVVIKKKCPPPFVLTLGWQPPPHLLPQTSPATWRSLSTKGSIFVVRVVTLTV